MTVSVLGRIDWGLTMDKDGHRTYNIKWLCEADDPDDGPAKVLFATGLPAIGSTWAFGNDSDSWAFCWPDWKITPYITKEKQNLWIVEQKFTTKPLSRCQTSSIENPLSEPDRISGTFVKYTKEVEKDKDGNIIKSSSHERIRGAAVEFDANRPTVRIEKNVSSLPLSTFAPMVDTVNDATLWGLAKRCVKLSNVSWARKLYGTCTYYYTVTYDFDIDYNTFDRKVYDEGTKVLAPGGDKDNPDDFVVYKDANGENTHVFLDGNGNAATSEASIAEIDIQYYQESNFLSLGIPTSL